MAGNLLATILALFTHRTPTLRMTKTTTDEQGVKHLSWVTKPEDAETIDDAFWIKRQRWGTFVSVGADDLEIITALTEELCISSTRWYLKCKQEGFPDDSRSYDGVVGGKL
jgi:hypothetical protein